ncbi:aldehyde dehydrogenase domain-containing protein [Xylariales sp. AK1849]|nr:aldehyde dehydrogenase domain-containing protein [Xylariales sp. AK1849]
MYKWDALIKENRDDLAQILTWETGKPLGEAYGEIDYALGFTWWFAGEAERIQGTTSIPSAANRRILTIRQPIGVCVALVPWNFPVAMILRKVGAALAAGCTMVVKPSPETPLSTLTLAYLATQAGFPPGVLNVLTTDLENTPPVSEALCKHQLVGKVTFTGSSAIGKLIARHCSYGLKKVSLELGGNCPFLIFDDANLRQALDPLFALKWRHAGQACVTANRVYVQRAVYDEFIAMFVAETRKLKLGHGADPGTTIGPVTTPRGITKVVSQVEDAKKHGGEVVLGGNVVEHLGGYYFEPTVVKGGNEKMLITHEESFAPIIAFYPFDTEDEVVEKANNTSMGLASYFFTKDVDRTFRLMENLEAGMIACNTGNSSAAEVPFGGMKESGYGKESGKDVAVAEYLTSKTITLTLEGHW